MSKPLHGSRGARILAENLIRAAIEAGAFDRLEGAGRPIPDIDRPYDPDWWVKKKLRRERMTLTREQAEALLGLSGARR